MEKTIEEKIKKILQDNNTTEIELFALVEIESEFDEDGEEIVSTANRVYLKDNEVWVDYQDYNGCDWKLSTLEPNIQNEILWTIGETLTLLNK